jgi:hypothetical protein
MAYKPEINTSKWIDALAFLRLLAQTTPGIDDHYLTKWEAANDSYHGITVGDEWEQDEYDKVIYAALRELGVKDGEEILFYVSW